jgi:hypothetical protein
MQEDEDEQTGVDQGPVYWVNATGYAFFQAYHNNVKGYPFYNRAYLCLKTTWLDK